MMRLLIPLLLLLAGSAQAQQVSPAVPAPDGTTVLLNNGKLSDAGANIKAYDLCGSPFGGAQAKCDYRTMFTGLQWSNATNTLNAGTQANTSAVVSVLLGAKMISITGSQPFVVGDIGKPLWVPASGTSTTSGWYGLISGFNNSGGNQSVIMSTRSPLAISGTVTLVKDYVFNCGTVTANGIPPSVGQVVEVPQSGFGNIAWSRSTVSACVTSNQVTTSTPAPAWTNPTTTLPFNIYTDDSAAANAAVRAALSRQVGGDRSIYLSRSTGVPTLTEPAALVIWNCEQDVVLWKPFGQAAYNFQQGCLAPSTPAAAPPVNTFGPTVFAAAGTAGPKVIVDFLGTSTFTPNQAPIPGISTFSPTLMDGLRRANGDITFVPLNRSIGGEKMTTYDSIPSSFPAWYVTHGNTWLSYIQADNPDLLMMEISANEGLNFSLTSFFDLIGKVNAWTKVPSLVIALTDEYSIGNGSGTSQGPQLSGDYPARLVRALCEIYGWGCVDFRNHMISLRDGVDRRQPQMKHWIPSATVVNTPWFNTMPDIPDLQDWGIVLNYGGTASAFCTAVGNEIRFGLSGNGPGGVYSQNIARFGCDSAGTMVGSPGAGATYIEVDVDQLHPGVGALPLNGTANDTWTIAGGNTLTASTLTPFTAQHVGAVLTIPNAAGSGSPCVTTISAFTSSSVVSIAAGCTNGIYAAQPLFFGNARIFTAYNFSGDATGSFILEFAQHDTQCSIDVQGLDVYTFPFPCAAYGGIPFHPQITSATNVSNNLLNIAQETTTAGNQYRLYVGRPRRVQPAITDTDITGSNALALGDSGWGECGGTGANHADCSARALVYDPVVKAQDWRIPRNGVLRASPTTGTTVAIPNRTSWAKLTPAGTLATLTLTMPPNPQANDLVQIVSTQVVTALTVTGAGGQTVVGAPGALAVNTGIAFRWDQQSAAWSRVQ